MCLSCRTERPVHVQRLPTFVVVFSGWLKHGNLMSLSRQLVDHWQFILCSSVSNPSARHPCLTPLCSPTCILSRFILHFFHDQVALGIHDLHKMGFVHRDIKPENILIDRTGMVDDWWHIGTIYSLKGHRHELFFKGLNILIWTFCECADGFQGLSKAFHYPIQLLTFFICFFEITF